MTLPFSGASISRGVGEFLSNAGSVAKNILTTFYSGNESTSTAISCVVTEFLQQSLIDSFRA
jgi:hypothetical protein